MSSLAYSGPTSIQATLLPARAAYLIRAGSASGFRRAIQEATTRWGGMTEPIIPIRKGGRVDSWWQQTVTTAQVNAVVNVDLSADEAHVAAAMLRLPLVDLSRIDHTGPTRWTTHPSNLGSTQPSLPLLAEAGSPLWLAVSAGDVTGAHEESLKAEGVVLRREKLEDQVARAVLRQETALDWTVIAFGEHFMSGGSGQIPAIVWVTRPNGLTDCLWFWNLRALRSLTLSAAPMLLLPDNQIQHWVHYDGQFQRLLERPAEFSPDVLVASRTRGIDVLDRLAAHLGLVPATEPPRTGHRWPVDGRSAPFTYRTSYELDPRAWFLGTRRYGELTETEAHFQAGRSQLRFSSPVEWSGVGATLLQLRGPLIDALPKQHVVAQMVLHGAEWNTGALQVATDTRSQYRFDLVMPTLGEALDAILRTRTRRHSLSDKGRLGLALAEHANVLLEPGIYEAAVSLMTPRSKQLARELAALQARGELDAHGAGLAAQWGGRAQRRHRTAANLGSASKELASTALEKLCSIGWCERGLEVACARCGMTDFVPLSTTEGAARCPGCRSPQSYTTTQTGPVIVYRLNTLADRATDQGVLPHLLVWAALAKRDDQTELLPGLDIEFTDGVKAELDIVGIHKGQFIVGEVKTNPNEFSPSQIDNDIQHSASLGADMHIMASVGALPDAAQERALRLAKEQGLELMILTAADLRGP